MNPLAHEHPIETFDEGSSLLFPMRIIDMKKKRFFSKWNQNECKHTSLMKNTRVWESHKSNVFSSLSLGNVNKILGLPSAKTAAREHARRNKIWIEVYDKECFKWRWGGRKNVKNARFMFYGSRDLDSYTRQIKSRLCMDGSRTLGGKLSHFERK